MTRSEAHGDLFLKSVGARVRMLRGDRQMTRRQLAEAANVSERYLGQLETGKANATLELLRRIASTLDEPLAAIIPLESPEDGIVPPLRDLLLQLPPGRQLELHRRLVEEFGTAPAARKGVALIGMRGAGKTTLGKRLADLYGVPFVRISDFVMRLSGMQLGELIEMIGPDAYRRFEYDAVGHIADTYDKVVVEAGGGLVTEPRTFASLSGRFMTVWLKAAPEEHMQRVIEQGDMRPMAGNDRAMDDLRTILREREAYYRQAESILDTTGRSVDESASQLDRLCRQALLA